MSTDERADKLMEQWTPPESALTGPYKNEGRALSHIFSMQHKHFDKTVYGGEEVVTTPEVDLLSLPQDGKAFFFKNENSIDNNQASVYGYIELEKNDYDKARTFRFTINPDSGVMTGIDDQELPDGSLLRSAIVALNKRLERDATERSELKKRRTKRAAVAATVLAASLGGAEGFTLLEAHQDQVAHKDKIARIQFDKKDIVLPAVPVDVSPVEVAQVKPAIFKSIPKYHKGDNLTDARKFNLDDKSCRTFSTPIKLGEKVLIATSKFDSIQNQKIIAGVDNEGDLVICSTKQYPKEYVRWTLAVQVVAP